MKTKRNQLLAVIYGQIFDWPLTRAETKLWAINDKIQDTPLRQGFAGQARYPTSPRLRGASKIQTGKLDTAMEKKLWKLRKQREILSQRKEEEARKIVGRLQKIPTILAIFLTGSVAVGNASQNSDIDLMVVTLPGAMWLTRFFVFWQLKSLKLLRSLKDYENKVCPNIFLDTDHLEIKEKNLYTAHEVLQAKCLFDRSNINLSWLEENKWTKEYLPEAYKFRRFRKLSGSDNQNFLTVRSVGSVRLSGFLSHLIFPAELFFFVNQYLYMRLKMTNERVGWGFAFFHPRNLSKEVVEKFEKRLEIGG